MLKTAQNATAPKALNQHDNPAFYTVSKLANEVNFILHSDAALLQRLPTKNSGVSPQRFNKRSAVPPVILFPKVAKPCPEGGNAMPLADSFGTFSKALCENRLMA
jgi:hypothetical protein